MSWAHRPAGPVVQALRWLGKDNLKDTGIVTTLASRLPDVVKKDIVRHRRYLPGWVADLARDLETPKNPAEYRPNARPNEPRVPPIPQPS